MGFATLYPYYRAWAPGGWDTKYPNAYDYIERQEEFRSGTGIVLNLTAEQEKILVECYDSWEGIYGKFSNNRGHPHKSCLKKALGETVSDSFFPVSIGNDLLDSKYFIWATFYPGPERKRGRFEDAPWAR